MYWIYNFEFIAYGEIMVAICPDLLSHFQMKFPALMQGTSFENDLTNWLDIFIGS